MRLLYIAPLKHLIHIIMDTNLIRVDNEVDEKR